MELSDWLKEHDLDINPILDGKPHRFQVKEDPKGEKSGWYVGSTTLITSGKEIVSLTVSDWRSDDRLHYRSGGFKNGDLEHYVKETSKKTKEIDEEKKRIQEEVAVQAKYEWGAAEPGRNDHPYLLKKGIGGYAKSYRQSQETLLIPCQDLDGKICGLQRISSDGTKRFMRGQRKKGLSFRIESATEPKNGEHEPAQIYICEGFATAASVYSATHSVVYAAFDAGNLNVVANGLRERYPGSNIIIAGDDDRFGEKNRGRESAELAAKECGGVAVFPDFSECVGPLSKTGTDWNDLFCMSGGIDEVRRQIENGIKTAENIKGNCKSDEIGLQNKDNLVGEDTTPVRVISDSHPSQEKSKDYINYLGHSEDQYFYTTNSNRQIVKLSRGSHKMLGLLDLMPYDYWQGRYPSYNAKAKLVGVNWEMAAADLMQTCRRSGIFNPEKIRGGGCWIDDKKLTIHLGDSLLVDGKRIEIGNFKSKNIYELGKSLPPPSHEYLSDADCKRVIDAVTSLKWKNKDDAYYLLGWLAISRISGALNWRPHIWLTGSSGSGKSTVLELIVKKIIGDWGVAVVGASSEAGIRQAIGKDSRPVLFDEAETTNEKSGKKIQAVLELVRQASSNTDSRIMKGTADQSGLQFKINCLFLLSSIRVNLSEEADKNRFTICELERNDPEKWPEIQSLINQIDDGFGDKLFNRSISLFDSILKNRDRIAVLISKKHNQRIGQQYGTLLAGYLSMKTGNVSDVELLDLVDSLYISDSRVLEIEDDESECLNRILTHKIIITDSDGEKTEDSMASLIDKAAQETLVSIQHYQLILKTYGLKVSEDGRYLWVAKHHSELDKIFRDTKWSGGLWGRALKRIKDAEGKKTRYSTNGNQIWSVKIPLTHCICPEP